MVPSILSIATNSIKHQSFVYTQLNDQTVLFQTIQFSISYLFAHSLNDKQFYFTHQVLPLWAKMDQEAIAMKGYLAFLKASSITGASPSDCLISYPGYFLGGSYPSAVKQSVYSIGPANWAEIVQCHIHDTH